jgi:SAM-dependent methyltransferase
MPERLYRDPLSPQEREEFERDLINFCDRELDLLGDIRGLDVLYAGGSSVLWIEGLSQRIGAGGSLTAFDADEERIEVSRAALAETDLAAPVRLVAGDVFGPPFGAGTFDLVYSAGLFHELDVRGRTAQDALTALARAVRPGGRVATSDFVDVVPAAQIEDEELQSALAWETSGTELYGIGSPERLAALHEGVLEGVRWQVSPPTAIRHLDKVVLAEPNPLEQHQGLPAEVMLRLRGRRRTLLERVRREGYTRPAGVYIEGRLPDE